MIDMKSESDAAGLYAAGRGGYRPVQRAKARCSVPAEVFDVFQKELKIVGSFINPDTHQRAVNLINEGKVNTKPLITHRYGLDELEDAIRKQRDPDSIKVMVKP